MADRNERVLFPERGSKVALGRVYGTLAFGSTKPRGMMPGHLTTNTNPKALSNIARHEKESRKITELRDLARVQNEKVFKLVDKLKAGHNEHFSSKRLREWRSGIQKLHNAEDGRRAPDKTGFMRNYGSLDKSTWSLEELRVWYNKDKSGKVPECTDGWMSMKRQGLGDGLAGLTRRKSAAPPESHRSGAFLRHSASTPVIPRGKYTPLPSPIVDSRGAGTMPGIYRKHSKHWSDREGIMGSLEARTRKTIADRGGAFELQRPWRDRPVDEAGPVPSARKLMQREKELFDMRGTRDARAQRERAKVHMQKGEGFTFG